MVASQIDSQLYDTATVIDQTEEGTMQGRILEGNKVCAWIQAGLVEGGAVGLVTLDRPEAFHCTL